MNKGELLKAMEASRAELLAALAGLSDENLLEPGVVGEWSVRDVLQHISLWEAEAVKLLMHVQQRRKPTGDRWSGKLDLDSLNARWHAETKDRPLAAVRPDFEAVRQQTIRRLNDLSDADLANPRLLPWLKGRPVWQYVFEDTAEHEQEHAAQIRAWRDARR
ncbi:MAG TPA: DinB family protein [Anaerolineales bacterium]|nr:DinB family protein [Anaerolineales bacterium]